MTLLVIGGIIYLAAGVERLPAIIRDMQELKRRHGERWPWYQLLWLAPIWLILWPAVSRSQPRAGEAQPQHLRRRMPKLYVDKHEWC